MILRLHGVFLVYLALALAWNLFATRRAGTRHRPWGRRLLLPLQLVLTALLLHDRLLASSPSWVVQAWLAPLFPLAFALALLQNAAVVRRRGLRLSDIPLMLFNVVIGTVLVAAVRLVWGAEQGAFEASLLHTHTILQLLLGTRIAQLWTMSWHVPLLLRHDPPSTPVRAAVDLLPAALGAFGVVLVLAMLPAARTVLDSFASLPRVERLRPDLVVGVLTRVDVETRSPAPPGDWDAWVLPADHDGLHLPPRRPGRGLVVVLRAPDAWTLRLPPPEDRAAAFLDGAAHLAAALHPELLLPFPEPDGEGTLYFGPGVTPAHWRELVVDARARVQRASPGTRLGLRLAGTGPVSERLFAQLAPVLDVLGPRLEPAGLQPGRAGYGDVMLAEWTRWRSQLVQPPALWILAVALSPLAYGEQAQERFVEAALSRASADTQVQGVLVEGWRDLGHSAGLTRADGSPRRAARRLDVLLGSRPAHTGR